MRLLTIVFLGLLLCACTHQGAEPDTVTVALDIPPTNLDPRIGLDITSQRLMQLLFSSLVKTDEHYAIKPDLAERWETPDPLTYIFHLRRDARFHDGRLLTAKDVLYTFHTMTDGSIKTIKGATFRNVQSIEAPDEYTVIFKLKEPFAPFLWNLTPQGTGIVPEGSGPDFARRLIGSGPFKFVRYIQDSEIVIERNDAYYGERPRLARVTFKIIPEAIVRALELRKGSVDVASNVLTPDMDEVFRHDPDFHVLSEDGTSYQYIAFNLKDPIFSDVRVRQAIAYAIDRERIIKFVLRGEGRPAMNVIPPSNWAFNPNVKIYSYDPVKARQLLQESGHPNLTFTFKSSTDDYARLLAAVLQQQLQEAGIHMEIQTNEFGTFFADVQKGNFQAYSLRWIGGNNDPDIFDLIFNSNRVPPNGSNRGHYSNPEVDRLIAIGRGETDMEKRRAAYWEVQRIVAEELPYVSLWYVGNVAIVNKRIEGMKLYPAGDYEFLTQIRVAGAQVAMR